MNCAVGKGILESEVSGEGQQGQATKDDELALQRYSCLAFVLCSVSLCG